MSDLTHHCPLCEDHARRADAADARVAELERAFSDIDPCTDFLAVCVDLAYEKARTAERERELAAEREVSAARLKALEWLRDQGVAVQGDSEPVYWPDIDDDQPALEFWENLSAAVGREVGPREGEQG